MERAVARAVDAMHNNLGEELTIDDMARAAMFSKFHFSRVFRRVTGISPGRFLSALRLQEAKRLLLATGMTVTEVSHRVGYASVGTFSSRFTLSVGVSPSSYRQLGGFASQIPVDGGDAGRPRSAAISGRILGPAMADLGLVFVGLFRDPIPQAAPVRCAVLPGPGDFELPAVPVGSWYVLAQAVVAGQDELDCEPDATDQGLFIGSHGPIVVGQDGVPQSADIKLRPFGPLDPPVLLALLDVRKVALGAVTT